MNRRLYALHRWLSAVAVLQMLAWMVSGLFFAAVPKERVMGPSTQGVPPSGLDVSGMLSAEELARAARANGVGEVRKIEVRTIGGAPRVVITGSLSRIRLDPRTAASVPVERDEAIAIAKADQGSVAVDASAESVARDAPIEYRDKPLPAWRVVLADGKGTAIWVDAVSGDVTARRNDTWRIYDFFWSLHTMTYWDRTNYRSTLLVVAASIGLLVTISGGVLWGTRIARSMRRVTARDSRPREDRSV
ncbi:MAG: PepSY domain-containing protein [Labilithrix sp.]|nr:PepSY domain-containing protein [Labilithrix sp.]MCW5811557.1 PepSY domain-containing protein [Labilithrix sp.]